MPFNPREHPTRQGSVTVTKRHTSGDELNRICVERRAAQKEGADGSGNKIMKKDLHKLSLGLFSILRLRIDHSKQLSAVSIKTGPPLPLSFPPLLLPPFHIVCVH